VSTILILPVAVATFSVLLYKYGLVTGVEGIGQFFSIVNKLSFKIEYRGQYFTNWEKKATIHELGMGMVIDVLNINEMWPAKKIFNSAL